LDTSSSEASESTPIAMLQSVPTTDDEIESAGTAFLDVIGKSLGVR
jgi:hypothetical protein